MNVTVKKKGNPRRSSKKDKTKASDKKLLFVKKVPVSDLRTGDRIARVLLEHPIYGVVADPAKTIQVSNKSECPGAWRTHVHINKSDCYDERSFVHVVI